MIKDNLEYILRILKLKVIGEYFIDNFLNITAAILIIIFYNYIKEFLYMLERKIMKKSRIENTIKNFITSINKGLINIVLIYFIIRLLGIDLTSLFAILGALGVVLGFAFKETLANFFGGLVILTFKPFVIGDLIKYKDTYGNIEKIELFYTKMLNFQNEMIIIPNSLMINTEILNINKKSIRRIDLLIGVGYDSDVKLVKKLLEEIATNNKYVLKEPKHIIGFGNIAASSFDFNLYVYVNRDNYLDAKFALWEEIKAKFWEHNIEMPYNKLDVNLFNGDK